VVLFNQTKYFKETKEGVETMCKMMEDYGNRREARGIEIGKARGMEIGEAKGEARGKTIGKKESSKEIALKLWNRGIRDLQEIAELTDLPSDEVKKLI